ncbi:MAG: hypothetical protein HRU72_06545 [Planctomycetia bacterium]|nr:hypothetical protein [Candidatus Brocadia sp.]QOJ06234.1 MAG: hypothetical protein HRU72_06545 [Planctomycetia bacterium]TVL94812.1 MAG: hypothetical protein CV082_13370 [Candidatus Brocadia sp. BL1]HQU32331.1 hypothetical protein [Candidatus Brocadia sapporoensis]
MDDSVDEIYKTLIDISKLYGLDLKILEKTKSIIKAKLYVLEGIYIQIYINAKKLKKSFALVLHDKRIFAKDYIFGQWHLHPFENPELHDETEQGRKYISIREFVERALSIIYEKIIIT